MIYSGGCFCGKIRYQFSDGEYLVANCHCTICRKTSAAPFVTWVIMPRERFAFTASEPGILESSSKGRRLFCRDCGTPLVFASNERNHKIDVTTCSLDEPEAWPPTEDAYTDTRLAWLTHSGT
jgi:hypothetical protein